MARRTKAQREDRQRAREDGAIAAAATLDEGFDDFVRLWSVTGPFFEELSKGETYPRRPPFSVRLPVEGAPPAKLLIAPGWSPHYKQVQPQLLCLELLVSRLEGRPLVEIAFTFNGATLCPLRWSYRYGVESTRRVIETIKAFLAAPDVVFARTSDYCGICGRSLTDPISRGRGIGPECHGRATAFREAVERFFAANSVSREAEETLILEARERGRLAKEAERAREATYREKIEAVTSARTAPDPQPSLFV
jgi:Family of unknown function (DUF6011)